MARTLSSLSRTQFNTQTFTLGATFQQTSKLTNEFRLGYARSDSIAKSALDGFGGAVPVSLGNALGNDLSGTPGTAFQMSFSGTGTSSLQETTNISQGRQWNLIDNVIFSVGRHQLQSRY